jgi:hypothetical protein
VNASLVAKRREEFAKAHAAAMTRIGEVNALRLERKERLARIERIAEALAAEQDRINALYPLNAVQEAT